MPIKVLIETKGDAFPDVGTDEEYLRAVEPVLSQVDAAIREFALHRIDRKLTLKDRTGAPCGEIEILRF